MLDTDGNAKARVVAGRHPSALAVVGLEKSYGTTVALSGVDLTVEAGTILGLLGPNGAGKTSLVSIVAGLRRPDAGRVEVCGIDVVRSPQTARRLIGIAPQDTGVYLPLRVRDNLRFFAGLAGLSRADTATRIEEVARRARPHGAARPARQPALRRGAAPGAHRDRARCTAPRSCCSTSRQPAPTW